MTLIDAIIIVLDVLGNAELAGYIVANTVEAAQQIVTEAQNVLADFTSDTGESDKEQQYAMIWGLRMNLWRWRATITIERRNS